MQTANDGLVLSETVSVVEIPFPPELLGRNVFYQRRKKAAASYRDLLCYRMNGLGTKC